jgi:hypothetical protein
MFLSGSVVHTSAGSMLLWNQQQNTLCGWEIPHEPGILYPLLHDQENYPLKSPFFRDPSGMSVRSISIGGDRRHPILRPKKTNMAIANPSRCVDDYSIETSHLCRSSYPFWGSNPDFTHPHMTIIVGNLSSAYWL